MCWFGVKWRVQRNALCDVICTHNLWAQCAQHCAQCAQHGAKCAQHDVQCARHGAQCALHGAQCALHLCAMCTMCCAMRATYGHSVRRIVRNASSMVRNARGIVCNARGVCAQCAQCGQCANRMRATFVWNVLNICVGRVWKQIIFRIALFIYYLCFCKIQWAIVAVVAGAAVVAIVAGTNTSTLSQVCPP